MRCNNSGPAHPLSLDLTIRPMKKDPVRVPSQAGAFWRATSSDPAFIARPPKGTGKLKPGWYVIRTRIVELCFGARRPAMERYLIGTPSLLDAALLAWAGIPVPWTVLTRLAFASAGVALRMPFTRSRG